MPNSFLLPIDLQERLITMNFITTEDEATHAKTIEVDHQSLRVLAFESGKRLIQVQAL